MLRLNSDKTQVFCNIKRYNSIILLAVVLSVFTVSNAYADQGIEYPGSILSITAGPVIPFTPNAYNVLWGAELLGKEPWFDFAGLSVYSLWGANLCYAGAGNVDVVGNRIFGLYNDANYSTDNGEFPAIYDTSAWIVCFEMRFGIGFKISEFFNTRQFVNLKTGITFENEKIFGKILGEDEEIVLADYEGYFEPAVYAELVSEIMDVDFLGIKKLNLNVEYGIRAIAFEQIIQLLKVGISGDIL